MLLVSVLETSPYVSYPSTTASNIATPVTAHNSEERIAASASGDLFASLHPEMTWLDSRREEIGALSDTGKNQEGAAAAPEDFSTNVTIGGGENLSGAAYFWFFAQLMLVTAVLFVIVAWFYQPREYLQEDAAA